ncbi:hypothetical protein F5144DRAFT_660741 [Chaetomium tenue]|uniref:Uncharacterized protein n=1 Tax=Chaetomium tenue TaxID=1854479 RepID=A0ACB7P0Y2_9PEZI|nr:hypothetical protein F5144DRAFT_660741 [Chaetomium globosum]
MEQKVHKERPSWLSISSSRPFRFVVGPDKREFTASSALIAHQSLALRKLVDGGFGEARNASATLNWADENTFTRFIQYVYTGDYDEIDEAAESALVDVEHAPKAAAQVQEPEPVTSLKRERPGTETQRPEEPKVPRLEKAGGGRLKEWRVFRYNEHSRRDDTMEPERRRLWDRFIEAANPFKKNSFLARTDLEKDYSQIFLCHAKMYVFADYYGITRLMDLSREKLGHLLVALTTKMEFHGQRLADFVDLVQYCYDEPAPEALQSFIMMYAAYHANLLWKDAQFQDLVEADGEVAFAFIKEIMPAYVNAKDGVCSEIMPAYVNAKLKDRLSSVDSLSSDSSSWDSTSSDSS